MCVFRTGLIDTNTHCLCELLLLFLSSCADWSVHVDRRHFHCLRAAAAQQGRLDAFDIGRNAGGAAAGALSCLLCILLVSCSCSLLSFKRQLTGVA